MDRKFVVAGLGWGILGLALGIFMGITHNHGQMPTHAHIMLAAFVLSFIYGTIHNLWLTNGDSGMAKIQFWLHQVGVAVLVACLFLVYGGHASPVTLEPFLAASSIVVFVALILMKVLFIRSRA